MNEKLQLKVCGMRDPHNIAALVQLKPDWMGFIFYPPSPRYVGVSLPASVIDLVPDDIRKTGVFVNAGIREIITTCRDSKIKAIQLHGNESPDLLRHLREEGFILIKTVHLQNAGDLERAEIYIPCCDYLLFEPVSRTWGGSGMQFDWSLLEQYDLPLTFFLSGGIGPEDAWKIRELSFPMLAGVDINSRFESAPGTKDIAAIKKFMDILNRTEQ